MSESSAKRGTLRSILRWMPLATILGVAALICAGLLAGGITRVYAWMSTELLYVLGAGFFLVTLVHALWRRRWRSPAVRTDLAVSLLALATFPWASGLLPLTYPASLETTRPAATVRLPADVPLKVAWGGDDLRTNYHAATPDQRWAYDLVAAPYFLQSDRLVDYGCYGVPVVAPASGLVTVAHDGEPDATPGRLSNNFAAPSGNHVGIRLDSTATHLLIAHLQPGSVQVETGERVTEGQMIGRCGNSGNTSEPHIHLHHQRQDPATAPDGFAEGLPLYFRDHDGAPMPSGGIEERDGKNVATGVTVRHVGPR